MSQEPEIRLEDVTFRYQIQPSSELAVESLNCTIERGEFVGITGASEAGKTTICRLLAGHIPHFYNGDYEGRVEIQGENTRDTTISNLAETVGYVFENPHNQLTGSSSTVEEEIAFALENMGIPRSEMKQRIRKSLSKVDIEHLTNRDPYQLSGGQSQRVAIASVLAMEPDIFVLQNPTSQLDPVGTTEVLNVIQNLNEQGHTIIISIQNTEQVAPLLDRLIVLSDGKIIEDDQPAAVFNSAIAENHSIMIPDVVRLGDHLRKNELIANDKILPLTLDQGIEEFRTAYQIDKDLTRESIRALVTKPTISTQTSISQKDEEPKVKIDSVTHIYDGNVKALDNISHEFHNGCTCILGQNGAGKSTLIKLLNGILSPTIGDVYVQEENTKEKDISELSKIVGLSFQNPNNQLFNSTVENEIRYGPTNLDYDQDQIGELTTNAIELFELSEKKDSQPQELSLALKKRIAIASIVAMDTSIVVLDEPTGGQDKPGKQIIGEAISHLVQQGKLVIVVTHDPTFALNHADRILVLSDGKLILDESPDVGLTSEAILREAHVTPPAMIKLAEATKDPNLIFQKNTI